MRSTCSPMIRPSAVRQPVGEPSVKIVTTLPFLKRTDAPSGSPLG